MRFVIASEIVNLTSALVYGIHFMEYNYLIWIYSLSQDEDSRGKILLYFFTGLSLLGFLPP